MLKDFGKKIKSLRLEKGLTKEAVCLDESQLSTRQLTRIESGQSTPTLNKAVYIAGRLGVTLGYLTDGENVELPSRYKELKYLLLRTQPMATSKDYPKKKPILTRFLVSFMMICLKKNN